MAREGEAGGLGGEGRRSESAHCHLGGNGSNRPPPAGGPDANDNRPDPADCGAESVSAVREGCVKVIVPGELDQVEGPGSFFWKFGTGYAGPPFPYLME